jgi:outer membrane protein assembly factor BamB
MSIRGSGGFASGKALLERIEKHAEHPLVRGPSYRTRATAADPSSPGKPGYDAASWPSHRGGVTRTGASRAATPTRAQISWTAQPEHPFKFTTAVNRHGLSFDERPVPPIIAAGTCFSAGSDGVISARSMADGRLRWRCAIDGPVLTPPAYAAGRLFVPGGDGWVYALDASNGSLAWKRRLAPMERRILLFEQLMSTWPVLSLAVADGVVYATAGMMPHDGGRSFALDAQGGDILWERFHRPTLGRWPTERQGFAGHTAVIGQRVWVPGYRSLQLCLDRSDGADPLVGLKKKLRRVHFVTTDTLYTNNGGQDVIQLGPEHVLVGGTHLLEEQNIRFSKHRGYRLFRVDAKGDWGVEADGPANVIHPSRVAPACDGKLIAFASPPMTMKRGQRSQRSNLCLNAWSLDRFLKEAHATAKLVVAKELEDKIEVKAEFGRGAFNDMPYDKANWQLPELEINVLALADNAVIAAYAAKVEKVSGKRPTTLRERIDNNRRPFVRFSDWKIGAFARKDGKEIWSLNLPCEPLYNGLAIAGDGSVVVTLRDGTMVGISKEEVSK